MAVVIPGCFRCTVAGTMGGHPIDNTLHVSNTSGTHDPLDVAVDIATAWEDVISSGSGLISFRYVAHTVTVQPLDGTTAPVQVTPAGWPKVGGVSAVEPVSAQTALILTLRTPHPGRSFRGRMFIAGVDEANLDVGGTQWKSSILPAMNVMGAGLLADLNGINGNKSILVVASAKLSSMNSVTDVVARQYLGTQRRRVKP